MKTLIFCCFLIAGIQVSHAQTPNKSAPREFVWTYQAPESQTYGPLDIKVVGTYYFTRMSLGEKYKASVHLKINSMEFIPMFGSRRYKYNGHIYKEADLSGVEGEKSHEFDQLRITSVSIEISPNSIENGRRVTIGNGDHAEVGDVDKSTILDHLSLNLVSSRLVDLNWQGSPVIESRINAMARAAKNKEAYKQVISDANSAFNAKKWSEARSLYGKAAQLQENERYPKDQIAKIDKILADENANLAKSTAGISNGSGGGTIAVTGSDSKAAGKSSSDSDNDYWGNRSKSNTTPSTAPMEGPPIAMDKEGNHYVKNSEGRYVQTSKEDYDRVKTAINEKRHKASQEVYLAAKAKNERALLDQLHTSQNRVLNSIEETRLKDERDGQLMASSFYARQGVNDARAGMQELSRLDGTFESLEELESTFNEQYSAISNQQEQMADASRNHNAASMDYAFKDANADVAAYKGLATGLSNILTDAAAERRAREARERLERERAAHERAIKERKWQALLTIRKGLLKKFPEGGVPLSSHKITADNLYFFSYVMDSTTVTEQRPTMLVSNVYMIQRYGDGSWPFKNSIVSELKKASGATSNIVMVGYYTDESQAQRMYEAFVSIGAKSEMNITTFTYKGKKSSGSGGGNTNFWNQESGNAAKQPATKSDDFWGSPQDKKPVKDTSTGKNDYWDK